MREDHGGRKTQSGHPSGNANANNRIACFTYVANLFHGFEGLLETDVNGKIEFYANPKPTDWTNIDITIKGYKEA